MSQSRIFTSQICLFNAIRENKILAKISEFTVHSSYYHTVYGGYLDNWVVNQFHSQMRRHMIKCKCICMCCYSQHNICACAVLTANSL